MSECILSCPNCANPMHKQAFQRKLGGELQIDICFTCKLIWFDPFESLQLAPDGLLEMFKLIYTHQGDAVYPVSDQLNCPRCRAPLTLTHDIQHSTRFVYYRCGSEHGRLTAFFQFLREKSFVRNLTLGEVVRLKADVKQVACSSCGAPINLETDSACSFCKAPISILDANAVQAALQGLVAAEEQQHRITDGAGSVENMIAALEAEQRAREEKQHEARRWLGLEKAPDLVSIGVGLVANGLSK